MSQKRKTSSFGSNVLFYLIIGSIIASLLFLFGIICLSLFWDGWKEYYHAYDFYVSLKDSVPEEARYAISPYSLKTMWIPGISGFVFPLLFTLLIEVPYVYFVLRYKFVKNIVCVNTFTNVFLSFVIHSLKMLSIISANDFMFIAVIAIAFVLFEFLFIPLIEADFYVKTSCRVLVKKYVIRHVYVVNMLSLFIGTALSSFVNKVVLGLLEIENHSFF